MSDWPVQDGVFECGTIQLQCGLSLPDAKIVWRAHGSLNHDKSNVIVYPTSYSARHSEIEWLIRPGGGLDPERYFIIIPNMFCNGVSTSPGNHQAFPYNRERFPPITAYDNVMQQKRLLSEVFAIEQVKMVYGWSMGAQQAYHWGALFGEAVEHIVINCGSARTGEYNKVFLESIRATLRADPAFHNGWFEQVPLQGLRAMGRIYAGWALSDAFYREQVWRELGYVSLEDFLIGTWEGAYVEKNANDLLAQLWTWQNSDISANERFNGDLEAALGAITAKVLIMPGETDRYFTVEDSRRELPFLKHATFRPIPSIWGHRAGNPRLNETDRQFIDNAVIDLLDNN